jgi:hypothetical protein
MNFGWSAFPVAEFLKLPLIVPSGVNSVIVITTAIFQSRVVSCLKFAAMIVIMLSADACPCTFYSNGLAVYCHLA